MGKKIEMNEKAFQQVSGRLIQDSQFREVFSGFAITALRLEYIVVSTVALKRTFCPCLVRMPAKQAVIFLRTVSAESGLIS